MEYSDTEEDHENTNHCNTAHRACSIYQRDWDTESLFIPSMRIASFTEQWKEVYDVYL